MNEQEIIRRVEAELRKKAESHKTTHPQFEHGYWSGVADAAEILLQILTEEQEAVH